MSQTIDSGNGQIADDNESGWAVMTKAELIESLADKLSLSKAEAERAINVILDDVIAALKQGERVVVSGFGTFSMSQRQSRIGRNPRNGEPIEISASHTVKFKSGKQLKDSLQEGLEAAPGPSVLRERKD